MLMIPKPYVCGTVQLNVTMAVACFSVLLMMELLLYKAKKELAHSILYF
jgi:hypothetical protein